MGEPKSREERRAEFYSALDGAMNLRPLYSVMDEEDKLEIIKRYPNPDRTFFGIFTAPINKLFDLGDKFRNGEV